MTGILNLLMGASSRPSDPYYEYTTLLLPGNGTNGAQNNTFLDGSTNNFTITRNGNTTQGTFSPFSQTGWSNYFPATSDTTENKISGTITAFGTGNFTVAFWVNIQGVTYSGGFATSQNIVDGANMFLIQVNSSNQLQVVDRTTSTIVIAASSSTAIPYNQWTNVALIRSGTGTNQTKLYVNGTEVGSATISTNFTGTTLSLGSRFTSSGGIWGPLYGYLSNFIYVDSALSPTTPTSPYTNVSGTRLLTCQSNRFVDNSSSPVTLTATSNVSVVPFSPFNPTASWSAATNGGSGYFDGNGDYLDWGPGSSVQFGTNNFTIQGWLYMTTAPNQQYVFDARNATQTANWILLFGNAGAGRLGFYDGSIMAVEEASASIPANSWAHVCVVRSGSTISLYTNGNRVAVNSSYSGNMNIAPTTTYIGKRFAAISGNNYEFSGYMSSLQIVKGTAVYDPTQTTLTVPTAPLTAITNTSLLLNFTNAGIYDATSKNDLETVGNAQISTAQSKWGGSSMAFDGTGDWLLIPDQPIQRIGTGNFTVEGWVYRNSSGTYGLVGKGTGTTGWLLSLNSSNQVVFTYGSSTITSTGTVSATTWTHIAVVREGTSTNQTKIYINGTNDGTGTVSTDFNQTNSMYVGADRTGGSAANVYMQDVRVTNYARYTANFTAPTAAFPTL